MVAFMKKSFSDVLGLVILFIPACSGNGAALGTRDGGTNTGQPALVYCWGFRETINPGAFHPTRDFDTSPVPVAFPAPVTQVSAGAQSNCAIMEGAVFCWGNNYDGQLGNGTEVSSRTPVQVDFSAF
jgi:hypothetical protein